MTVTVRFHRVLRCPPERVYRAFTDPDAWVRWLPPFGFTAKLHQHEPVVGGAWRMSFTNFSGGGTHHFGGVYRELVPGEKLVYTARFDDPNLPGDMQTAVQLRAVLTGCELQIEQSGIPDMIPAEACTLGWQESLVQLAQLVEPTIPSGA